MKAIGKVYESTSSVINIKMDFKDFEDNKEYLNIGNFLKISTGNNDYLLGSVSSIRAFDDMERTEKYILSVEPIGSVIDNNFKSGITVLPSPTELVYLVDDNILKDIFSENGKYNFNLGKLANNEDIDIMIDGNSLFSKHLAVVGSTGSGKSCTVAKILQKAIGIDGGYYQNEELKNSHIILFDIHSEYQSAFTTNEKNPFSLNLLDIDNMKLPYWLMNSEELEALFIESNELNSHNQISIFKKAVIKNKQKYNKDVQKIKYDSPLYFDIQEVYNYIVNINNEIISKENSIVPRIISENGEIDDIIDDGIYFEKQLNFIPTSTKAGQKASKGPFNGEFDRFINRLENKISDNRLSFIMSNKKENGECYETSDFENIIKQFTGYIKKSNITIIDLSGIPFEVLSITISLVSRLIFDFAFHYTKLRNGIGLTNDIPFLIVCEEAHNYIPQKNNAMYNASKKSIEKIAKEGRKYGLSLMIVSQRPSEVSDTIFSQCNNFIALKLTNVADQSYVKSLLPNNSNVITEKLPILTTGYCLIVGESTPMPSIVRVPLPDPKPKSDSIKVHDAWGSNWVSLNEENQINIKKVIERWKR